MVACCQVSDTRHSEVSTLMNCSFFINRHRLLVCIFIPLSPALKSIGYTVCTQSVFLGMKL